MSDKLTQRLTDARVAHDTRLLGDFTRIYCDAKHADRPRLRLASEGADLGVYGKSLVVCEECAALLVYAEKRRAFCPQDKPESPKPFCSHCPTHCYKADMREYMRDVMRFAGPRSMLHSHAVDGIRHMIEGRRHKAAMKRAEAGQDEARQ